MTGVTAEQWEWDINTGEILRTNSPEPLDFTREREGRLAAAAPSLARALLENMEMRPDGTIHHKTECSANGLETCDAPRCVSARAAITRAGLLP